MDPGAHLRWIWYSLNTEVSINKLNVTVSMGMMCWENQTSRSSKPSLPTNTNPIEVTLAEIESLRPINLMSYNRVAGTQRLALCIDAKIPGYDFLFEKFLVQ